MRRNLRENKKRMRRSIISMMLVILMVLSSVPQFTRAAQTDKSSSVTVATQPELMKALSDESIRTIIIETPDAVKLTVPKEIYKAKTLVINSSKATVTNNGVFKKLIVTDAGTLCENAAGNNITIKDKKLTFKISKSAKVKNISIAEKNANCNITANGEINQLVLLKKASIVITGDNNNKVTVKVRAAAKGSIISSSVPVDMTSDTAVSITFNEGAEGSKITSAIQGAGLKVVNNTKKRLVITTPEGKQTVASGARIPSGNEPSKVPGDSAGDPLKPVSPTVCPTAVPVSDDNTDTRYYTVNFDTNGGNSIPYVIVAGNTTMSSLPVPLKNNSIFLGWYTDSGFQKEFSENTPVNSDLILYAKYAEIETKQQNLEDSFTLMEQKPELTFSILSTDASMTADQVKSSLLLSVDDGSKKVELTVTGSNGSYLAGALGGFTEGASYTLTLNAVSLSFENKESTIRKCSFTIAKEEVYNIKFNDDIIYIPKSNLSDITENGVPVKALSEAPVEMNTVNGGNEAVNGTFNYSGSEILEAGGILCVYSGDKPVVPTGSEGDAKYLDDEIAYIKVTAVEKSEDSQKVSFSDADAKEVIFLPDVLPIAIGEGSKLTSYTAASADAPGSFTVAVSDLNFSGYKEIGLSEATTVDEGDYLVFYPAAPKDGSSADSVTYGEVTGIAKDNGNETITFSATTEKKMQEAQDYYSKNDITGDILLQNIDISSLEKGIEQQVQESGFAENVSAYLSMLAIETDGFKNATGGDYDLKSLSASIGDGTSADLNSIKIMSLSSAASKAIATDLRVNASITRDLQKLGGSGVRCAVAVSFNVPIQADDNTSYVIRLSATFVEELNISVNASADSSWSWKWVWLGGILPLYLYTLDEYQLSAGIDTYQYTGVNFEAHVTSQLKGDIDISKQLQSILSSSGSGQITSEVQKIYDIYSDMMNSESDWIQLFRQNIFEANQSLLLGVVKLRTSAAFVVSTNINAAIGCNFEYINGTRYNFWANMLAMDASSKAVNLIDKQYNFRIYNVGSVGLRAGIVIEFAAGIISLDNNSIGLTAEAGVYTKLYGFFYYNLKAVNEYKNSTMSGAYYLDLGAYLEIKFKAKILNGKYQYNPTIFEYEWPLLRAGDQYNVYGFADSSTDNKIKLKDNVKSYTLPDSTFHMTFMDLKGGNISTKAYNTGNFNITFSDSHFYLSGNTVKVNVPAGTHRLLCDMKITWKGSALAFSSLPITRTFHLVWDDLNDNGYTISFNSNGGSAVGNITKLYETAVAAPAAPVRKGYTFDGWYSGKNLKDRYTFHTMPAQNIILYAKWTANTDTRYRVEHYRQNLENDSYTLYETQILKGTTDTVVQVAGMSYEGFTYNGNVKDTISAGTIEAEGSLVLKLYYGRNSYLLTFKPENGGNDIIKTLKYGAALSAPTVVKTGYTFKGWDKAVEATMPAQDTTYTACFTINNYTIEFQPEGGSLTDKITLPYGTAVTAPVSERTGYTFLGWYLDSGLMYPYTFSTMPAKNFILYAKWNIKTLPYRVEYYQQNSSDLNYTLKETENLSDKYNTAVTAKVKDYEGFTLNNNVKGTVNSGTVAADGKLTLKLYYDRNTYTMSFVSNGGGNVPEIKQKYGTAVSAPTNPVRPGYTFEGWYSDTALTNRYIFSTMPAKSIVLYGKWKANDGIPYKVEYYQQNLLGEGYTLIQTKKLTGICDTTVTAEINTYEGFNLKDSSDGKTAASGVVAADGSLVLKLYYDRNKCTISFISNKSSVFTINGRYGTSISQPEAPVRLDYTFEGWYADEALTKAYTFSTIPAVSITLYAKWKMNTEIGYKVEHYTQDEGKYKLRGTFEYTGKVDTTVTAVPPTLIGYTYNGLVKGTVSSGILTAGGNLILRLYFDRNICTISFVSNGGSNVAAITGQYGTSVNPPDNPTKLGYIFAGWYRDTELNDEYSFATFSMMPPENITLYAKWNQGTIAAYHVEHYQQKVSEDGYTLIDTETINGTVSTTVTAAAKAYEGFCVSSCSGSAISTGTVAADGSLTLKLYYDRNTYTISFLTFGGNNVEAITQKYGTDVAAPDNPIREGSTFDGWYSDINLLNPYTISKMPAGNITLYAKWKWDTGM